jgi:Dolichyl-phosphate-mannose-protein mannosyltransferase
VTAIEHGKRVGLLMAAATLLLGYLVARTDVFWADGLRYIAQAKAIDQGAWSRGLVGSVDHPAYPIAIAAVHRLKGGDRPRDWQTAAQVAAAIAGALLVIPTYLIALELFGESTAWLACVLIFSVPSNSHVLADALSESTFLLFFAFGLWAALRYLRAGAIGWLVLASALSVLAYLTRPEGLVLPAALFVTLVVLLFIPSLKLPAGRRMTGIVFLALGPILAAGPFVVLKGGISTKPSILRILGLAPGASAMSVERERPLDPGQNELTTAILGFKAMLRAVAGATTIPLLLLAPLGLAAGWTTVTRKRDWVFLGVVVCACALAMSRLHAMAGYCTPRHAMVVAWILMIAGAAGLNLVAAVLGSTLHRFARRRCSERAVEFGLRTALAAGCLALWAPGTLAKIDPGFAGYRQAGEWLATAGGGAERVIDPKGFALYYSERPGYTFANVNDWSHEPGVRWVVAHEALIFGPWEYSKAIRDVVGRRHPVRVFPLKPVRGVSKVYVYDLTTSPGTTALAPVDAIRTRR